LTVRFGVINYRKRDINLKLVVDNFLELSNKQNTTVGDYRFR
jgi:hypothetical protein